MDCDGWALVGDCCVDELTEEPMVLGDEIGAFMMLAMKSQLFALRRRRGLRATERQWFVYKRWYCHDEEEIKFGS